MSNPSGVLDTIMEDSLFASIMSYFEAPHENQQGEIPCSSEQNQEWTTMAVPIYLEFDLQKSSKKTRSDFDYQVDGRTYPVCNEVTAHYIEPNMYRTLYMRTKIKTRLYIPTTSRICILIYIGFPIFFKRATMQIRHFAK
jgi:hypothetical protein